MRTKGSPLELERRRRLAVQRVEEGHSQKVVADMFGLHPKTVSRWVGEFRSRGDPGLAAKPHPGRAPKLPRRKHGLLLGWLRKNPKSFGFANELWTGPRVAQLIKRKFGVCYHPRYVNEWLTAHNITPQKPQRQPRRRNEKRIQAWLRHEWPRIQNARVRRAPI